jgi:undecaprenyl-diphosphatase
MRAVVGRGRPLDFLPVIHHVYLHAPAVTGSGYPSGHTTTAAAFVGGVAPFLPRRARRVAWIAVVLVALARVYVGAHLPLDVVGGFALGVSVGAAVNLVFGTQEREPEQARIA